MKHRSLIAIAAVGTLILAACGDDDDDAADTAAVAVTAEEAEAPAATPAAPPTEAAAETSAPGAVAPLAVETSAPGASAPLAVETSAPGASAPLAVETSAPGAVAPLAVETSAVETTSVETSAPETSAPETSAPETVAPLAVETSAPETTAVETTAVETTAVETTAVETTAVETTAVETTAVETTAVETTAVETTAVETSAPETSAPETVAPLAVETSAPETTAVETTAVETTAVETTAVETTAVETTAVETSAPETSAPETSAPETSAPETVAPLAVETSAPETSAPETTAVETTAVETTAVETSAPETSAPETSAPETVAPLAVETSAPETSAPETSGPETSAPESSVPAAAVGTGPECAELPDFGEGALAELADDPAGTAITNNLETATLQQLLGTAGLLETLDGEGPFTVFAPTNGAFTELTPEQRAALLADPEVLAAVLSFHVVEGESLSSEDLAAEGSAVSLEGEELDFTLEADVLTINGEATAVCGDIPIANGTLYLIDTTLIPEAEADALAPATTGPATTAPADGATASTGPTDDTTADAAGASDATATTEAGGGSESASGISFPVTPGEDWPDELVFTLTPSQEAGGLIETAEPLAQALAERLGVDVEALVPSDYAGVIVALQSDQAQIAGGLGPVQMVQAEDEAGAELILQSERFGEFVYVTQWFTNDPDTYCGDEPVADPETGFLFCNGVLDATSSSDGPIGEDHLADVAGQTVAFVDQGSASGYLVPSLQLLNAGVDPVEDITPLFAGGHDAAVQAVYDGDAAVGVSFNDARGQLVEQIPDVGEQVVVFAWSFPIPNDGFAVGGDLPPDLQEAITAAFIDIAETPDGQAMLQELYEIDGLQPVDSSAYDSIRELRTELADLLE